MLVCGIQSLPGHFSIQTWDAVVGGGGGGALCPPDAGAFAHPPPPPPPPPGDRLTPGPFPTPPMYVNGKVRWGRDDCLAFTKSRLKWHSKINTCCYTGYTTPKDLHATLTNLQVDGILIDSYTVGRFLGNCLPTPPLTQY